MFSLLVIIVLHFWESADLNGRSNSWATGTDMNQTASTTHALCSYYGVFIWNRSFKRETSTITFPCRFSKGQYLLTYVGLINNTCLLREIQLPFRVRSGQTGLTTRSKKRVVQRWKEFSIIAFLACFLYETRLAILFLAILETQQVFLVDSFVHQ